MNNFILIICGMLLITSSVNILHEFEYYKLDKRFEIYEKQPINYINRVKE